MLISGEIFVRDRCADVEELDGDRLARAIELTRFPVPEDDDHKETDTEPGLVVRNVLGRCAASGAHQDQSDQTDSQRVPESATPRRFDKPRLEHPASLRWAETLVWYGPGTIPPSVSGRYLGALGVRFGTD